MSVRPLAVIAAVFSLAPLAIEAETWMTTDDTNAMAPSLATTNVGIGFAKSAVVGARFRVAGGVAASGAGLPIILEAQKGAASSAGGNIVITSGQLGTGSTNGSILFGIGGTVTGSAVSNEKMRIDQSGKVGIGNTVPMVALDVSGSFVTGQGIIRANSTTHSHFVANAAIGANESGLRLSNNNTIMWDITQNQSPAGSSAGNGNALTFYNGTAPVVKVLRNTDGYFGIGLNHTPTVQLDVKGNHIPGLGIIRAASTSHSLIMADAATGGYLSGLRLSEGNAVKWDLSQNDGNLGGVNQSSLTFSDGAIRWFRIQRGSGKVGIGSDVTPSVQLDVNGSYVAGQGIIRANSSTHSHFVANAAAGANESGLRLSNNNTIMWDITQNQSPAGSSAGNGNALTFYNGTAPVVKVLRNADGYFGIGLNHTPTAQLDVKGNHIPGLGIIRATSTSHALIMANSTAGYLSGVRLSEANAIKWDLSQNDGNLGGVNQSSLTFSDGAIRWFRIQRGSGRVGIGSDVTPSVQLDVVGDHVPGQGIIRASSSSHAMIVANAATGGTYESGFRFTSGGQYMWDITQNSGGNGNNLAISSAAKPYAVTISQATGNVGIGAAPSSSFKLDVNGAANISGALTVASVNTSSWSIKTPDYVFEKGYKLPSLDTVHAFVKKNKHLPEIPSAKELDAKGMDLADMNLRLLKKVEELTLYMIDQKQALTRQALDIAELKAKNRRLEKIAGISK